MTPILPFLDRDLAASRRTKNELRVIPRVREELVAALTMLHDVFDEAAHYGPTYDLQERYASLRRWILRSPDEVLRILADQRAQVHSSVIATTRLETVVHAKVLWLVEVSDLAQSLRRGEVDWKPVLEGVLYEARLARKIEKSRADA